MVDGGLPREDDPLSGFVIGDAPSPAQEKERQCLLLRSKSNGIYWRRVEREGAGEDMGNCGKSLDGYLLLEENHRRCCSGLLSFRQFGSKSAPSVIQGVT